MRTGRPKTHGLSCTAEFNAWQKMHHRCSNKKSPMFYRYGARGIKVCARWSCPNAFLADMGLRPTEKHSLDRIDVDGDYTPENCRWATPVEQMNNTSRTRRIDYKGQTKPLSVWCRELGLKYALVRERIRGGWTVERAFDLVSDRQRNRKDNVWITHNGETKTLAEWGRAVGQNPIMIRRRMKKGMPAHQAIFNPPTPGRKRQRPQKRIV